MVKLRKRLGETADYDQAGRDMRLHGFDTNSFTDQGRADTKNRPVSPRFGDNAMRDQALDEYAGESSIDELHAMLTRAGISDQWITQGLQLTPGGQQKVAAKFGIAPTAVQTLINSLVSKLRDADRPLEAAYEAAIRETRYSYEKDALGTVTVRDAVSGKEVYLQGSDAADLLHRVRNNPADEQAILGTYQPVMEADLASAGAPADSYDDEIAARYGSYNFPWKDAESGEHGFATMRYGEVPQHFQLIRITDADGEAIRPDRRLHREIVRQGRAFIAEA